MAISVRSLLYDWFGVTLRKPSHQQFINLIDSFWHKAEDLIPIDKIDNLPATLAAKADNAYVDAAINAAVTGLLDDRGNFDASINEWPVDNGSGNGGEILKGDVYFITVAGTLGGVDVSVGDTIRALIDSPVQVDANWAVMRKNAITSTAPVWGGIGGDIGNQTDLVTLLNLFAHYNILIELNTTTPKGVLADVTAFTSALIADNPNLIVSSYIIDGYFVKINCTGLKILSSGIFASNKEIVGFKDLAFQIELIRDTCFRDSSIREVFLDWCKVFEINSFAQCYDLQKVCANNLIGLEEAVFADCSDISNLSFPNGVAYGLDVFLNCSNISNLTILKSSVSVTDLETANGITANILAN